MTKLTQSRMFCVICGHESLPIWRRPGKQREPGHLKKLYCEYCKVETNHAECREFGKYGISEFKIEFENGNFNANGTRKVPWKKFVGDWRNTHG